MIHHPVIQHYPICSDCGAPYVLRRAILFDVKMKEITPEFVWQRDCRHKKAPPKIEHVTPPPQPRKEPKRRPSRAKRSSLSPGGARRR